jgi:nitric-oxide synthase
MNSIDNLLLKAKVFLHLCYKEINEENLLEGRLKFIEAEIKAKGTYFHTYDELAFGARVAWRNSNRCIGRLYWKSLQVIDNRTLDDEKEIEKAILNHIKVSTNNGAIKPLITVFRQKMPDEKQGIRIHNSQLINYAGYLENDNTVIGDPKNIDFTNFAKIKENLLKFYLFFCNYQINPFTNLIFPQIWSWR